ncbi:MAG TPA: hypothetical protein VGP64_12190 [Polyangia bacterium]
MIRGVVPRDSQGSSPDRDSNVSTNSPTSAGNLTAPPADDAGMSAATILFAAAGVVGALVVAAIVAVTVLLVRTERLVESAATRLGALACPCCGVAIGAAGAAAAATARAGELRALHAHAREQGLRLRVDPHWRFLCRACGAALKFDPGAARGALTRA